VRRLSLMTLFALAVLPSGGSLSAAPLPVVTVTSGPTTPTFVFRECNDAVEGVDAADSFVVHRDVPDASPLAVAYTTSGPAISGTEFEPLSGLVTIPANAESATVPVTALLGDRTTSVHLSITISGSADYAVGDAATVTLVLVVHRDPALGPLDCNPNFQLGPEATNHEQTIHVGETPVALTTTGGSGYTRLGLVDGELPPGISISGGFGTAGHFLGTATTTGDYRATLDVCPGGIVFTCRRTTLVIHVLAATQPPVTSTSTPEITVVDQQAQLPVTGTSAPAITIIGLALLVIGAIMARSARRRADAF
jgi:LPXTG-motif cell wall-anchored protein